mmetsp:Transcript_21771/g.72089  ORF Transcript_21771/g.72089 Transcript_21771/m.72089 type:complete len:306 (-) Transcript_21771:47-964(-)
MTRTEKLEEETFVDGFLVTEHGQKDDAEQWPPITESSVPPPKKRVKTTASRKTCAPRDAPHFITADESSEKVPRARDGADRDDDAVGYEDEAPPRAAPSLLASFDAAAASSSSSEDEGDDDFEDEDEDEDSDQEQKSKSSQYLGVSTNKHADYPWRVEIMVYGDKLCSRHATEEEAARAYDGTLRENDLVGTYGRWPNFPLPEELAAKKRAEEERAEKRAEDEEKVKMRAEKRRTIPRPSAKPSAKPSLTQQLAAAVSERDALRAVLDAACAERDALRSERDVVQGKLACMASFKDELLAKLAPG